LDKFANILNRLRQSLWLVPGAMSAGAAILAWLLLSSSFEAVVTDPGTRWWLFSGDAGTARDLLSSLLSGLITMTSLVVSITMVVLSLAAGQLGPRLIISFIRDRQIQVVLGLFIGTIVYTLLVLRSVTDEFGSGATPHIAVAVASALTLLCLFALLFYVHKIARSIIADTVVREVADALEDAIAKASPEHRDPPEEATDPTAFSTRTPVSVGLAGYVQVIDYGQLVEVAAKEDVVVETRIRAGHFVLRGGDHFEILSNAPMPDALADDLRKTVVIGPERTSTQDLEYSVRQLVEIAVRALSPGINDPFTALAVVNRLGAALECAAGHLDPPSLHADDKGVVRVRAHVTNFVGLLDASFDQIRQAATGNAAVLIQMSDTIGQLGAVVEDPVRRAGLLAHLQKIERAARRSLPDPADLSDFADSANAARKRLAAAGLPEPSEGDGR
jgi:uncharacterized membrane protein